ncbi:lysylphosphatidylglycerol synthase domain-containing protein [Winogradskyella schleiferi]|uniref:lysylphosphatidylglycerol synthase domain-containing protein n=1 Tax=Winogradskyella schleiferi TaxID=2686078 RepID=UPI0015BDED19|nr:lysylphosphatidylglycerol synthase domain-containing protein [Winogradskyella schleiferi]
MNVNSQHKTKQFFVVLIKLGIVVAAFYFIYSKIAENENLGFSQFISFLKENNTFSIKNMIFLLLLSCFNWFFEILKWQYLVKTLKRISFKSALEQSLGGQTASLITPNRLGDYGAKAVYYKKTLRTKIVLLNLLGNMAQMTITTFLGVIGLLFFINRYPININHYNLLILGIIILVFGVLVWLVMKQKRFRIKGFPLERILQFIKNIPSQTHITNLTLSLTRYLVFSFQFYYLLTVFGVHIDYLDTMVIITSMYLLASILPSISIFDVVVKGSIAVFLFGYADINELTILSITTIMWLLNFVIPSVFGSYFVLNFKLPKPVI